MDSSGLYLRVDAKDVRLRAFGNSDNGVGVENGGSFHPGTHRIPTAELLRLPRAKRLQGVGSKNKRNTVQLLCEIAGHRHIPGVGVDDVDAGEGLYLCQVEA